MPDPDFVIVTAPSTTVVNSKSEPTLQWYIKVNSAALSSHSKTFADMFEAAKPGDPAKDRKLGLPYVKLDEGMTTVRRFLSFVHPDIEKATDLTTLPWKDIGALFEMAVKYHFKMLQLLCELEMV